MRTTKKVAAVGAAVLLMALTGCAQAETPAATETPAAGGDSKFSQELHDALPAAIKDKGFISFVGENNPPYRNIAADGSVGGLQTAFLDEFEEILGIEIRTETIDSLAGVKLGLQSGRNDAAFGPSLDTAETQKNLDFIDVFIMRTGFLFPVSGDDITQTQDVCGKTVALQEGSPPVLNALKAIDQACIDGGNEATVHVPLADKNAAILAVKSGRAEIMATSPATMVHTMEQQPGEFGMFATSEEDFAGDLVGTSLAKGNDELRDALFGAWQILFEDGTYAAILAEFGMESVAVDEPIINGATQ